VEDSVDHLVVVEAAKPAEVGEVAGKVCGWLTCIQSVAASNPTPSDFYQWRWQSRARCARRRLSCKRDTIEPGPFISLFSEDKAQVTAWMPTERQYHETFDWLTC
jgi:hypothetical protein